MFVKSLSLLSIGVKVENRQVMVNKEMPTVTAPSLQPQMGQGAQTEYKETPVTYDSFFFFLIKNCNCHKKIFKNTFLL